MIVESILVIASCDPRGRGFWETFDLFFTCRCLTIPSDLFLTKEQVCKRKWCLDIPALLRLSCLDVWKLKTHFLLLTDYVRRECEFGWAQTFPEMLESIIGFHKWQCAVRGNVAKSFTKNQVQWMDDRMTWYPLYRGPFILNTYENRNDRRVLPGKIHILSISLISATTSLLVPACLASHHAVTSKAFNVKAETTFGQSIKVVGSTPESRWHFCSLGFREIQGQTGLPILFTKLGNVLSLKLAFLHLKHWGWFSIAVSFRVFSDPCSMPGSAAGTWRKLRPCRLTFLSDLFKDETVFQVLGVVETTQCLIFLFSEIPEHQNKVRHTVKQPY